MRKNILKKIRLISRNGFFASSLLNIGAMEECKKNDRNISILNNKSSNNSDKLDFINIINENYKNKKNNFKKQRISCNKIDNDKFFCDKYQIYKLFNDKDEFNFIFDENFSKQIFQNIIVFDCNKNNYNMNYLKIIDSLIKINNKKLDKKDRFECNFYTHDVIKNSFGYEIEFDESYNYLNKNFKNFEEKVNINIFKKKLKEQIIDLYIEMKNNGYYTSEKLFKEDDLDKYNNDYLIYYYILFNSINYMIDFFKNNFPNIYKRYEEFISKNSDSYDNFNFTFRNNNEFANLKDRDDIAGKTNVYYKNKNGENIPFSISFYIKPRIKSLEISSDCATYLLIVRIVVHEMLHFITESFIYNITNECEVENGLMEKSYELCYIYFLYAMDKLNDEDKENFKKILDKIEEDDGYLGKAFCNCSTCELPVICLTDFFMDNINNNMKNFLKNINNIEKFGIDKINKYFEKFLEKSFDGGSNTYYTKKIGEIILNFFKQYDNSLNKKSENKKSKTRKKKNKRDSYDF